MTIRQMLLTGSGSVAASVQSFKGYAGAAATSVSLPTHAADDLIVIVAGGAYYGEGTEIPIPAGYTEVRRISDTTNAKQAVVGFKKAADGSETSGTWTGASQVLAGVWDGFSGIGGSSSRQSSGSTVYWNAVTMSKTDGTSWVVGMNYASGFTNGLDSAPTGMTNRGTQGSALALHDTAGGVSSWATRTTTMGTSGQRYVFTFELVAE